MGREGDRRWQAEHEVKGGAVADVRQKTQRQMVRAYDRWRGHEMGS